MSLKTIGFSVLATIFSFFSGFLVNDYLVARAIYDTSVNETPQWQTVTMKAGAVALVKFQQAAGIRVQKRACDVIMSIGGHPFYQSGQLDLSVFFRHLPKHITGDVEMMTLRLISFYTSDTRTCLQQA